jgi:hypothetical protein
MSKPFRKEFFNESIRSVDETSMYERDAFTILFFYDSTNEYAPRIKRVCEHLVTLCHGEGLPIQFTAMDYYDFPIIVYSFTKT